MTKILTSLCFCVLSVPLSAQWLGLAAPGVPRNPDGTPNLQAPAPRAPDGKPDLSGIWDMVKNRPCPETGCPDQQTTYEFLNLGYSLAGGLPYQPWARELFNQRRAAFMKDDPGSGCRPIGVVKLLTFPFPRKIVQTPGILIVLNERDATFRQIFTDGRALPKDPQPAWNGYSTGRWDGDTLVVETNGLHDGTWIDAGGNPLTSAAKVTERYRRLNFGRLEIEVTIDDPKAYTKPWTVKINQEIMLNTELLEFFCTENEKDTAHFEK